MNKKSFIYFLFFLFFQNNLYSFQKTGDEIKIDPINYKMQQIASTSAGSSRIFLLNFAFDELKKNIILDMQDHHIQAIVINDHFFKENVIIALKNEDNEISFLDSKEIPKSIKKFKSIKKQIIDEKDYTKTILGDLTLYYDDKYNDISLSNIINFSQKEKKFLKNKKIIKVCADPNWMPFEGIKDGMLDGISADYVKLFSQIIDIPMKLVETKSWDETLNKLKQKDCDIIPLANQTKQRKKYMLFTSPYLVSPNVIVTKLGVPFINDIEKVKDKKIGIIKSFSLHETLKSKYKDISLIEIDSILDGLNMVKTGEIFGYIDNSVVANYHIQEHYLGILTVVGVVDQDKSLRVAIRDDEPILRDIFQKVIDSLDEDIKQEILNKWVKINYSVKTDYTLLIQAIVVFMIILLIIFYWNRKLAILNKQLAIQRDKANAATRSKSDFLANMSHEIRTPMNGIIGMTELALKAKSDNESKKYVQKIDKSTKLLLGIINDILDFSKMEANKLQIEKIEFDLLQNVNSICDLLEYRIKEKNLELIKEFDIDDKYLYKGDSLRISQVLSNFLSNAIKFTPNGFIKVKIKELENNRFYFCVEDSGIGLSEQEQTKLFKPFSQSDQTISRQYGGTGLGLAISKQLVNLMDGNIGVESQISQGSKFYFELELEKIEKQEKHNSVINETKDNLSLDGMEILLVEDNIINQEIIVGLLGDKGVEIDIANNGAQALEIFDAYGDYDLILMDIQMPIMDGIEATKKIRELNKDIPIIALSANIVEKDNDKSIGFNDYLLKPIDSKQLQTALQKYFFKKI